MRIAKVLAGVAVLGTLTSGGAAATEPIDTIERLVGRDVVPAIEIARNPVGDVVDDANAAVKQVAGGIDAGGAVGGRGVNSAVVGYIQIVRDGTIANPTTTWALFGALADPNEWSCSGGGGASSFSVTCTPVTLPLNVSYTCQVLHADVNAVTVGASGRTIMDCNSDGVPEAQTGQKIGPAGYDTVWAVSTTSVTSFTCTMDLAAPLTRSGCGDPGLVTVE
jgi:hypothetical protein